MMKKPCSFSVSICLPVDNSLCTMAICLRGVKGVFQLLVELRTLLRGGLLPKYDSGQAVDDF
jgi:hypothetical protein